MGVALRKEKEMTI